MAFSFLFFFMEGNSWAASVGKTLECPSLGGMMGGMMGFCGLEVQGWCSVPKELGGTCRWSIMHFFGCLPVTAPFLSTEMTTSAILLRIRILERKGWFLKKLFRFLN